MIDLLHHLTLRTTAAAEEQREKLLEPGLFDIAAEGDVRQETEEVFGPESKDQLVAAGGEVGANGDVSDAANEEIDLHARFL